MPRFAAIDVGSNALRLRIIETGAPRRTRRNSVAISTRSPSDEPSSAWREVTSSRASVRLGADVFLSGRLTPTSINQACAALRDFRTAMDEAHVDAYRATATSAVREASNANTLTERAKREAGIDLEVIEGIEEARLIQLSVARRLRLSDKKALLVDVGGGSTELTLLDRGKNQFSMSLPLGTVRLLETFLKGARSLHSEHQELLSEVIDRALAEALPHLAEEPIDFVIGTGGNIDTLVDHCPYEGGYGGCPRAVDTTAARAFFLRLVRMSPAERKDAFSFRSDRADTIVPAMAIFLRIAERFHMPSIVAPGVGLREGILEELIDKHFHVWDAEAEAESVLAACMRLGQRYHFDQAHGTRVERFAATLFDDLQSVHGFSERDRLLLRAAALLHDIGDFVRYDGHHKHSYYIIQHSDIMGLSPGERSIVANLARYHRKGMPDPSHPNFRELDRDARGKVRGLASLLRIADALDREHRGKVENVRALVDTAHDRVVLALTGDDERELEEWTVHDKSNLLRDVYGLDVTTTEGIP